MSVLKHKKIVLGVCGSIAAYKAIIVARLLTELGSDVAPILTSSAQRFVGPMSFSALCKQPCITNLWDAAAQGEIGHVELAHSADLVICAPASAHMLAKMSQGMADDPLCALLLATRAPVLVAPAMETGMWQHPATVANLRLLRERGVHVAAPEGGALASGRSGMGRLRDPAAIVAQATRLCTPQDLAGQRVLVTAGPTREALDPARYLSNPSTGKMGYALAEAAAARGAEVHLVSGPTALTPPDGVRCTQVVTCAELLTACETHIGWASMLLMAAAPADFRPAQPAPHKVKKQDNPNSADMTCSLVGNPDILMHLDARARGCFTVGFAAETQNVLAYGEQKLTRKNLDMLVANDVGRADTGFASDTNAGWLLRRNTLPLELPLLSKRELADVILSHVAVGLRARA